MIKSKQKEFNKFENFAIDTSENEDWCEDFSINYFIFYTLNTLVSYF